MEENGVEVITSPFYFELGATEVTASATNAVGTSTCSFLVTVTDNQIPVITSNGDQDVFTDLDVCGATVVVSATATDNCFVGEVSGVRSDGLALDALYPVGVTTIAWNVIDENGNNAQEVTQTITVEDNQIPVITSNGDQEVFIDLDVCGATVVVSASASDNCSVGLPIGVRSDGLALDALYPVGVTTISWNVIDENGNNAQEVTQTITVEDNQIPVITSNGDQEVFTDLDVCGATVVVSASASDNCSVGLPIGVRSDGLALDALYPVGVTTISWNVIDENGNNAQEVTQTITVEDNQIPVITSNGDQDVATDLDVCGATVVVSASASDNCSVGLPIGERSDGLALDALYPVGTTTIAWNVSDANSNNAEEVIQTIVVTDNQMPNAITQNTTVQLDAAGIGSITVADIDNGSNDNCGVASVTLDNMNFDCSNVGANTVTLTVTDNNNNVSTATAVVTVEDNVAPDAVAQPLTVQLDAAGNASITAEQVNNGSSDACGIASLALDIDSFDCSNVGPNTVTLTVTDNNNNVSTATAVVTVEDNVDPIAVANDITVQLDASRIMYPSPQQTLIKVIAAMPVVSRH